MRGKAGEIGHYPCTHIRVKRVITAECSYLMRFYNILYRKPRGCHADTQRFCLITAGNHTAVIVRQHNNRFIPQLGTEQPFAGNVEIITVNEGEHPASYFSTVSFFLSAANSSR